MYGNPEVDMFSWLILLLSSEKTFLKAIEGHFHERFVYVTEKIFEMFSSSENSLHYATFKIINLIMFSI